MFSGIVQTKTSLKIERSLEQLKTFSIALNEHQLNGLATGASVALNGVCLTVTSIDENRVTFDVMMETLKVTNLGDVKPDELVNVERAARFGDDIGGHIMSGHITTTLPLIDIQKPENNTVLWLGITPEQRKYLFPKGFVGLNGCSLTIGEVLEDRFNVYLIPETLSVTTFSSAEVGQQINIEFDAHTQAIVETLERMQQRGSL